MKKVLVLVLALGFFMSCTPESLIENGNRSEDENFTEKGKLCPPSDRNCNGIPDAEE